MRHSNELLTRTLDPRPYAHAHTHDAWDAIHGRRLSRNLKVTNWAVVRMAARMTEKRRGGGGGGGGARFVTFKLRDNYREGVLLLEKVFSI